MFFGFAMTLLLVILLTRALSSPHYARFPYTPPSGVVTPPQPVSRAAPLEILRERYARGEIDTDTFEMMAERLMRYEHGGQ